VVPVPKVTAMTTLVAREGRFAELVGAVDAMVAAARDEEGTEVYLVSRATRVPDTLFVFELFSDKAAFKAHAAAGGPVAELLAPLVASSEVVLGEPVRGTGAAIQRDTVDVAAVGARGGADTRAVHAELGLSTQECDALVASGAAAD
jgi:quinol monooxygenase YgiN